MSFQNGIFNLTNWAGNVIMPTLSGLLFAIGFMRFVGSGQHQKWLWAGFLSLMVSGILRGLETFASQTAWDDPDLYWIALMSLVFAPFTMGADWTTFGHDPQRSGWAFEETTLSPANVSGRAPAASPSGPS